MKKQTHSRLNDKGRAVWFTEGLWSAARNLPAKPVRIDQIKEFDMDCWFDGDPPTCRAVAGHAKRIMDADLSLPVILSSDGKLMDGGHRIAKAWIAGSQTVMAVQFVEDPPPDFYRDEKERNQGTGKAAAR